MASLIDTLFRRRSSPSSKARASVDAGGSTSDAVEAFTIGRPAVPRPPVRTDWAKLPASRPTGGGVAPLTIDGRAFGRGVAGAREFASSRRRHRHDFASVARDGVLLDAASVGSITPRADDGFSAGVTRDGTDRRETDGRQVGVLSRTVRPETISPRSDRSLTNSDERVKFAPFVPRHRSADRERSGGAEPAAVESEAWTISTGFAGVPADSAADLSRMRLVGRAGSLDDAIRFTTGEETATPDTGHDDAADGSSRGGAEPQLRFVAVGADDVRPPADVVAVVRAHTGIDVGDTVIDRSPGATRRASDMGAIAFTDRGRVHLPAEIGDLDDTAVRGVIAHELTHVAQHRRGDRVSDEASTHGRTLEHEARRVQHAVAGRAVRPLFVRTAPPRTTVPAGVQRLADDDDPYEWQERPEPPSVDSPGGIGRQMFSLLGDVRSDADERSDARRDNAWARDFEHDQAWSLQRERDARYAEIVEEAHRELELRQRRGDAPDGYDGDLDRSERLEVRRRLDDEMPWQFGPPPGIELYPEPLGENREPEGRADGDTRDRDGRADGSSRTLRATPGGQTLTGRQIGQGGPGGSHRRARGPGSGGDRDAFEWQGRDATTREAIGLVVGGALGSLIQNAIGDDDEDASRERREREQYVELRQQRHAREIQLRHVRLRELATTALQEPPTAEPGRPAPPPSFPIPLEAEHITQIRRTVDEKMPLEFVMPEYVDDAIESAIDRDGTILERAEAEALRRLGADVEEADADNDAASPGESTHDEDSTDSTESFALPPSVGAPRDRRQSEDDTDPSPDVSLGEGARQIGMALVTQGTVDFLSDDDDSSDDLLSGNGGDTDLPDDDEIGTRFAVTMASASEIDMDDLARKLYDRVRRELRHELLIDRERSGALADAR